ncbi:MAG: MBL fold metallo-hydrolase [Bdellovibrionales bacterium]|nr:MBL fold metallo-hydrolase [Bdellovibrionales bacterium]
MSKFSEVLGNSQKLDGGAMFGNVPRALWEKWSTPDEKGRINLACRTFLIENDNENILLETGIGAFFEPKLVDRFGVQTPNQHQLLENLASLDKDPKDIQWVILSHLHFDHAGGLLPTYDEIQQGHEELVFENARFVVSEEAWKRAIDPHPRDQASFIPGLVDKLQASGRLHIVKQGASSPVWPEHIEFIYSHGHTPGHMHTLIQGEKNKLFFAGDLVPGTAWVHLPITMGYDRFPEQVINEKMTMYERAEKEQWEILYTHDPIVACSQIGRNEKNQYIATHKIAKPQRLRF